MRAVLILLASTGCSQIFGIETPQRLDSSVDGPRDAAPDTTTDSSPVMSLSFQNGVGGYTSERDTYIDSGSPDASRENDSPLRIRNADRWGLIDFKAVFGNNPEQVPATSTITGAHVELVIGNNNCQAGLADIVVAWPDAVTYNTFGPTPGPQMTEDFDTPFVAIPTAVTGKVSVDVMASLQRWQMAPSSRNGWLIVPTGGTNDCTVRSGEENILQMRPKLVVSFTR